MRPLDRFLDPRLVVRCQTIRRLTAELWEILPPEFQSHAVVVGCEKGIMSILVDSPAWATRLRFIEPQILHHFSAGDPRCERLKILVRPDFSAPRETPRGTRRAPLSRANAQALLHLAETVDDPQLAQALQRLVRHTRAAGRQE
ncbi:MAG: DUF721 domain-containing protein [Gammaproteobacteria bacterium]|nr:DUF721 domain-containing protein [Gammaproteobacteria bacterium]